MNEFMDQAARQASVVLIDVDQDIFVRDMVLVPGDLEPIGHLQARTPYTIRKCQLEGGLRHGVNVVEIDNRACRITVVPDRGMGIWKVRLGQLDIGWQSPIKGPVHPSRVPIWDASGIGFLEGFDELLCRCGLESNGAPEWSADGKLIHPLHGKIANTPAHYVAVRFDTATEEVVLTGVVDEARLFGQKLRLVSTLRMRPGEAGFRITDRITNLSTQPADLELLYHVNFGTPLVGPGSKFYAAAKTLVPRDPHSATDLDSWQEYGEHRVGAQETVLYFDLATDDDDQARVLLTSADNQHGVSMAWRRAELPTFSLWKTHLPIEDGYVTGLEPGMNFPNVKSYEKREGRVTVLGSGESREATIAFDLFSTAEQVAACRAKVEAVARGTKPQVFREPQPHWSV